MTFRRSHRIPAAVFVSFLAAFTISLSIVSTAWAAPPSPELLQRLKASGQLQKFVDRLSAARARGVDQPARSISAARGTPGQGLNDQLTVPDTVRIIVIMVDFSDNPAPGGRIYAQPSDFQQELFSDSPNDNQYSLTEFYRDNSYGKFLIQGTVVGWFRAPQTYAYYVDGQNGFGSYPHNAQKLAEDAIQLANPVVDFSQFDADGDGMVDCVFIVHAGTGAEESGLDDEIWSHESILTSPMSVDGVQAWVYTMEPEEDVVLDDLSQMGLFAHEYGHALGLPDLYDVDYSSSGVGVWSLMGYGMWNLWARSPAFLDAWCKSLLGWLTPTNIAANATDVEVPASYYNPVAYRLWANGSSGSQYFLIENRQKGARDIGLPNTGLLILHVDESINGNWDENHPEVAVEQADGLFQLEAGANEGDATDVWSATTKTDFNDLSTPNTRDYSGQKTKTAVWGISASDSVMTANFAVTYSRPRFEVLSGTFSDSAYGNGNGIPEAGESLTFSFNVENLWLTADNVTGTLTSDNSNIVFTTPTVNIGTVTGEGGTGSNTGNPIVFQVPTDFAPCIDSFFLTMDSDVPGGARTFGFELHIGNPTVLLVDDDNGATYNQALEGVLFDMRVPFDRYDKSVSGSPAAADLTPYQTVIWLTGDARPDILSAADVSAMQAFLDGGGNLFLTGQEIVKQLDASNQSFLNNYLHATYLGDQFYPFMYGVAGTAIGDGLKFRYDNTNNQTDPQTITPTGGGVSEFTISSGGTTVLSYTGSYNVVLMSFGFEAIADQYVSQGWASKYMLMTRIMDFFEPDTASLNPTVSAASVPAPASILHLVDAHPTFVWSVDDTTGAPVTQWEVEVGTGSLCYNQNNMWSPGVFNGSDTEIVYAGLPLEGGQTYVLRVRAFNGTTWSAWMATPFHMNSVGTPGVIVMPADGSVVTTTTPVLKVTNTIDPEGDTDTYEFDVYSDEAMTNLVGSASGVPEATASNQTAWTVTPPLVEDGNYWWHSRAFDGYEWADYTQTGRFGVNADNQAPLAFDLIDPPDGADLSDYYPRLSWSPAVDNDGGDMVHYTLYTSTSPDFTTSQQTANLVDTFRTLTYPLGPLQTYYWKVAAIDRLGATTWSTHTFTFTSMGICCLLRGNVDGAGEVNVGDMAYLVAFLFKGGPAPPCDEEGDVDYSGTINVSDVTYLVAYIFRSGPPPPPCM